jgi:hypothetical protein
MRKLRRILSGFALIVLLSALWNANSAPATKNGGLPPLMVSTFGADLTGANDATTPLNNCLSAAGSGGICAIDRGAVLKLLGNPRIPAHTTLDCQQTFPDAEDGDHLSDYPTMPALKLDSGRTIQAGGIAAQIQNCLVYRNGMTFPAADASAFAGTAISADGNNNFTALNIEVIGFNTCVDVHGTLRTICASCISIAAAPQMPRFSSVILAMQAISIRSRFSRSRRATAHARHLCEAVPAFSAKTVPATLSVRSSARIFR